MLSGTLMCLCGHATPHKKRQNNSVWGRNTLLVSYCLQKDGVILHIILVVSCKRFQIHFNFLVFNDVLPAVNETANGTDLWTEETTQLPGRWAGWSFWDKSGSAWLIFESCLKMNALSLFNKLTHFLRVCQFHLWDKRNTQKKWVNLTWPNLTTKHLRIM